MNNTLNDMYCVECDGIVPMEILNNGIGVCPFCDDTLVVFPEIMLPITTV